jgi:hypothetical protein
VAEFKLWAAGDAHVGTDMRAAERESLADAITQSESDAGFKWDAMIDIGDLSGSLTPPDDDEGREVLRQYRSLVFHRREQVYNVVGNHDASGLGEATQWWFRTWIDPAGEHPEASGVHPERRLFPVDGNWERYSFRVGNMLFLMMGDRNDVGPPVGRGAKGGYPAGAVTRDTFDWWRGMVEANPDSIIVTAHHHMLCETTVASGPGEGVAGGYHGRFEDGAPDGAAYLYWIIEPDGSATPDERAFETYLEENPGAIDLWLGGHTHTRPDDTTGGRSHVERKWDVTFVNVAALTRYHGAGNSMPMSRLFTFEDGSDEVRIQLYLHTDEFAPQGFYEPSERSAKLRKAFSHEQ